MNVLSKYILARYAEDLNIETNLSDKINARKSGGY